MEIQAKNGQTILISPYKSTDFNHIQHLNELEGWTGMLKRSAETREAWQNSNIAYVAVSQLEVIGYLQIILYVCELLIKKEYRSYGIGQQLIHNVHSLYPNARMEMLASSSSHTFYEHLHFRPFYGFRKNYIE
ncbi:putative N-acetyltransferase YhbS [Peribacillus deserti]|uniref:N-acetyltransferase YhbS n=1 Tax=Peribacillus deserti TaxID=673318 RepID=A0ABS2QER9_9BACI|nr:GNAT family N-acetyltransferase [Peribacillus deserti]MBM7691028.1 putative N-acetyltransferase YhbS [Peribacillus deserti]